MAELVECARLEIAYSGNTIEGSNPPISAIKIKCPFGHFIFIRYTNLGFELQQSCQVSTTSRFWERNEPKSLRLTRRLYAERIPLSPPEIKNRPLWSFFYTSKSYASIDFAIAETNLF